MPEGTIDGRRYRAGEVLPHSWSGPHGRGLLEKALVGNTHFFRSINDRRQRHLHFMFLLQDLFHITVVVKPHRIALVPDDLGLFFQLLGYLGFRFASILRGGVF